MKNKRNKQGISLIVLVIAIIVMIILATAIILSLSSNRLIDRANAAVKETNLAQAKTLAQTIWADEFLDGKRGQNLIDIVKNRLEQQGITDEKYAIDITDKGIKIEEIDNSWEIAFVYDIATAKWGPKILATDNVAPTGDIVVRLYNTGEVITPDGFSFSGIDFEFNPGPSYKMVIQGTGAMGALATLDMSTVNAWQLDTFAYANKESTTCIIPYVTEIIVGQGIINIPEFAFFGATGLTKIVIPNSIETIDNFAFTFASNLTDVTIPNSWSSIEESNQLSIGMYNDELLAKASAHIYRTKVERLANEGWQKAYDSGSKTVSELETQMLNYIKQNGVSDEKLALYNIDVTTTGVTITGKDTTLGEIVLNGADYGKTINYSANGINDWLVLYEHTIGTDSYVYLTTSDELETSKIPAKLTDSVENGGSGAIIEGQGIYWSASPSVVSQGTINKELWLASWGDYSTTAAGRCITYLLDEIYWTAFKNTEKYGENVVGAIGTATLEMFVASYNQRSRAIGDTGKDSILELTKGTDGYKINNQLAHGFSRRDKLIGDIYAWLASPADNGSSSMYFLLQGFSIDSGDISTAHGLRPVVCLKSSTPVRVGLTQDSTDIVIK